MCEHVYTQKSSSYSEPLTIVFGTEYDSATNIVYKYSNNTLCDRWMICIMAKSIRSPLSPFFMLSNPQDLPLRTGKWEKFRAHIPAHTHSRRLCFLVHTLFIPFACNIYYLLIFLAPPFFHGQLFVSGSVFRSHSSAPYSLRSQRNSACVPHLTDANTLYNNQYVLFSTTNYTVYASDSARDCHRWRKNCE